MRCRPRIDFPLRRQEERAAFEVSLLADTQPENGAELAYLRDDIVAGALGCGAAFGINHGDVVFDDLSLYPRYLQILGASGIPWHHCPGNHDINSEARDDRSSRETWKRVFGPRHYAFQYAGATFIMLDNVHYFGHNPGTPDSGRYCGQIGEQQLHFVRNVLANVPPEQLVVLSMHIPLVNYQDPSSPADNTIDRRALLELLASRPHTRQLLRTHASDRAPLPRPPTRRSTVPRPITITSSRPPPAAGGAGPGTGAAFPPPIARTAPRTASMFSPSMAAPTRRASSRPWAKRRRNFVPSSMRRTGAMLKPKWAPTALERSRGPISTSMSSS